MGLAEGISSLGSREVVVIVPFTDVFHTGNSPTLRPIYNISSQGLGVV